MEFRLLGPVGAWSSGRPVVLGRRRERCLLGLLLLEVARPVPVTRLIDLLWDGDPPPTAAANLHTSVSRLRTALTGHDGSPQVHIARRGEGYVLEADPNSVDAHRFTHLVELGRATDDQAERRRFLTEALALWRGQPLADAASDRLRQRVCAGLEQLRRSALDLRIETDLAAGRHEPLIGELSELIERSPDDERMAGHLMVALYRAGRRMDALNVYQRVRRRLADDLGLDPGSDLARLEQAILRADPNLDPPSLASAVTGPVPRQLPRDIAGFIGRGHELAEMDRSLVTVDHMVTGLVLIVGPAGVGKTALIVHWGHHAEHAFPDGNLYVDLRGYDAERPMSPIEALAGFLRAVGVPAERVPVDVAEAAALFRSHIADRQMLVVLDNARSAEQVRPLLPGAGKSLVLVASRHRLGGLLATDGGARITLDVLDTDDAIALLTTIIGAPRTATERPAAADLARACGYLPLALRVAGANLADHESMSIGNLVDVLREGDRLSVLRLPGDPAAAVLPSFDCSYAALTPLEQRLLRLLGLVPGADFTTDIASALLGTTAEAAAELLTRLSNLHLIQESGNGRASFHDLLRDYARLRAAAEDPDDTLRLARSRMNGYYLRCADAATRQLYPEMLRMPAPVAEQTPFDGSAAALAWLDLELANLVAAAATAADNGPHEVAWLLADALLGYFWHGRNTVDWLAVAHHALRAAETADDTAALASAQLSLGMAYHRIARHGEAEQHLTRAAITAGPAGWPAGEATALGHLGSVYIALGRLPEAVEHHRRAWEIKRNIGWRAGQASELLNLGVDYLRLGRLRDAAESYTRSLALLRRLDAPAGTAIVLGNLGEVYCLLGEHDRALAYLREAHAINHQMGNLSSVGHNHDGLAALHRDAGRLTEALEHCRTALDLKRQTGELSSEAWTLNTTGTIHLRLGHPQEAVDHHARALKIARETDSRHPEGDALVGLSHAYAELGQATNAIDHATQAIAVGRAHNYRLIEGDALSALAGIHLTRGDPTRAAAYAQQAGEVHRATGHRLAEARALRILGHAVQPVDEGAAHAHWHAAKRIFADVGVAETTP